MTPSDYESSTAPPRGRSPSRDVTRALLACAAVVLSLVGGSACAFSEERGLPTEKVTADFVFEEHAFSFANFGGQAHGSLLTADHMERMFGADAVCNSDFPDHCRLLPIANEYRAAVNQSIRGGRCEGFAVLSGLASRGEVDLSPFGAVHARDLVLEGNAALGAEIAYWFASQYLRDVVPSSTRALSAVGALKYLNEQLQRPDHEMFRVGIARLDPDTGALAGGHAVLATYVAPGEVEDQFVIGIYDNNHPEAEREIRVDALTNAWSYQASTNPDNEATVYAGDLENGNPLYLSPAEPRRGEHRCTFCSDPESAEDSLAQMFGSASAELIAHHPSGARIGEQEGALVSEHNQGHVFPSFTAPCHDCRDGVHAAVPHHPEEGTEVELRQAVHGPTEDGVVEDIYAAFFGHGFVVTVEGADVEPGEVHSLFIPGHGAGARYLSPEARSADVAEVSVGATVAETEQVHARARVTGSERIELAIDPVLGNPTLTVRGPLAASITRLSIETTLGPVTRELLVDLPTPPSGSATVILAESSEGGDVVVELDRDGDGVTDETITLPDLG
jgi:hypothetical protein